MDLHPEKRRDLGRRVEVFWDADGQYYRAVVVAYHPTSKKHTIMYEDGGREKLNLDEVPHRWAAMSMDVWRGGHCCWQHFAAKESSYNCVRCLGPVNCFGLRKLG